MILFPLIALAIMGFSLAAAALGGSSARGRAIGIVSSVVSLSSAIAPALFAPTMNHSFGAGFSVAAVTGIGTASAALLIRRGIRRTATAATNTPNSESL